MLRFGVLGPLQLTAGGAEVALGSRKQRAVLAMLLINRNRVVGVDALIDAAWGGLAGQEARASLHTYVAALRRLLNDAGVDGRSVLAAAPPGYRLSVDESDCDVGRFAASSLSGVQDAAAGRFESAGRHFAAALAEWRGRALEDLADLEFASTYAAAVEEDRLTLFVARAEAEIACGRAHAVIGELERLTVEHPFREPLWAQLITAYHVAGRQSDALDAYARLRAVLNAELGIEPGPAIRTLHDAVLRQEVLDVRRAAITIASARATTFGGTAAGSPAARLRASSGEIHPLVGPATRIGRLPDNDIVLDDAEVSRHHAVVSDTGSGFVVTDLRSANGVRVGGRRIRGSVALAHGDRVRIGGAEFVFESDSGGVST